MRSGFLQGDYLVTGHHLPELLGHLAYLLLQVSSELCIHRSQLFITSICSYWILLSSIITHPYCLAKPIITSTVFAKMSGGTIASIEPTNLDRVEAPVTFKAYLICVFAAFGGIFFGYDSGYINGIMGMQFFIHEFAPQGMEAIPAVMPANLKALIVSILSAGTFIGACKMN